MTHILEKIVTHKRHQVQLQKAAIAEQVMIEKALSSTHVIRPFMTALKKQNATPHPAVIAEIKKASPSLGVIRKNFQPEIIAKQYDEMGATCLSVLTDEKFFQGDLAYIQRVKSVMPLPVLRKDFIIDPYQIYQSRAYGVDCILLIVAILNDVELLKYTQIAQSLGLDVLVEVHDADELKRALRLPVDVIGVNNRDLRDFSLDLHKSIALNKQLPKHYLLISESGFHRKSDIQLMQKHGINSFLIGGSFMQSENPGQSLRNLLL